MKNMIKPMLAAVVSAALFFGVGAFEVVKIGQLGLEGQPTMQVADAQFGSGIGNPACLDNYTTWHSSTTYKSTPSDWATGFVSFSTNTPTTLVNNFERDINGDGLPDYMYIYHAYYSASANYVKDCVYLSNGHGWTKAYQCFAAVGATTTYYGDCAQ